MVERDIFEVANQLEGYVDEGTPHALANFLLREGLEAAKLADTIVTQSTRIAALEAQLAERVKVKPLEWVELNEGKAFRALLPVIGSIRIEPYGVCGWWEVLWSMPGQCDKLIPDVFDTPDEAKAAAQADFDRRILSALEATPHARADRLKDEPTAFLVERIAGSGYGRARKVIDAAIYDPRRDDFWIGDAKKNHLVTPLYAPSTLEAAPPAPKGPWPVHYANSTAPGRFAPPAPKVRELLCDFEDFINEPPQYEELRMVRDYRHELYRKWEPLSRLILSALEATPTAPKATEAIRAMGENPDEQLIGELTVFDAVAAKVRSALTAAQEAAPKVKEEFKQYRRKQVAELRPWSPGECMDGVSVSDEDAKAGSPKLGDMIARNPKNHDDKWLVAAAYFADNFEPMGAITEAQGQGSHDRRGRD